MNTYAFKRLKFKECNQGNLILDSAKQNGVQQHSCE
jgi:hypothetical protein